MAKKREGFTGGEETLYTVTKMGWKIYEDHLPRFTNHRQQYTAATATAALLAGEQAAALPTIQARNSTLKDLRTTLETTSSDANGCWQDLAGYIEHSFEENRWANMKGLAGSDLYKAAANHNWKSGETMLEMASQFITKYNTELLAGGMPALFATDFEERKTAFETAGAAYNEFKTTIGKEAEAKSAANIAVYNTLAAMFKDGRKIFRKEGEIKKLFSYAALVTKGSVTAFRIVVKQETTNLPGTTTTIMLQPGNIKVFPDKKGIVLVPVKAGKYILTTATPEYETITKELVATANVRRTVNITLKKTTAKAGVA
jgi:hypothetical protein